MDAIVRFEEERARDTGGGAGPSRPYALTRLGGVFGAQMAEYVLLHVLAQERGMRAWEQGQRERRWKAHAAGVAAAGAGEAAPRRDDGGRGKATGTGHHVARRLGALRLGVLGYGDIGAHVARQCRVLGMTVVALRRGGGPDGGVDDHGIEVVRAGPGAVTRILASCDYIVNLLPSTRETRGLLPASAFADAASARAPGRRPAPCFINVGRGDVTGEADLVEALDAGHLRACVLDVFAAEPLPRASPLWTHPRVTVTPHVAAQTSPDDLSALFARNLANYCATGVRDLLYPVHGAY